MAGFTCVACRTNYAISDGRPIMIRPDNWVFQPSSYLAVNAAGLPRRTASRYVPQPSVNLSVDPMIDRLAKMLDCSARVLVVGAGTQRSWLGPRLGDTRTIVYCDIDVAATVDLFCDAHDLPFGDASFDAVITTAVLEHVLYPERAAQEISRVVRPGGLLYSELPFMQQVHEGAYDFTRFTLSGHRRLFNGFDTIEVGMVAGPATSLVWAIENFLVAFPASPRARQVARAVSRLAFGWIKYFDHLLKDKPQAMDGASCTYILGCRRMLDVVPDHAIIDGYVGGRALRHS